MTVYLGRSRQRLQLTLRPTLRLRLTLLNGILLVGAGAILVLLAWLLVGDAMHPIDALSPGSTVTLAGGKTVDALHWQTGLVERASREVLVKGLVALLAIGIIGIAGAYAVAGRALRPLHQVTQTAQRLGEETLDQRIRYSGADDEVAELARTFDAMLDRLAGAFESQKRFVANASHELRTPLARQRTLLEVALRDRQATNASLRLACERALVAGEQQERLIAALLTLARGERGLDTFEPFDLGAVAAGALEARRDEAQARGVTVTTDLGPAPALGDPRLAERLVANLADNAIRYNEPGGLVEITAGRRDDRAFLAVTNTGPVIPPDQLGRLFQPFQRLAEARRAGSRGTDQGGLGLGLAIVSAIAAAHGAALHAVTRVAGGLTIEVIFPPQPAGQAITDQTEERPAVLA